MSRPGLRRAASVSSASASLLAAGAGGVPELATHLTDDSVAWALLRWEVGSGTFVRSKLVAIHFNGDEVPTVRRGRLNARSAEVLGLLGEAHATIEVKRKEDLHLDFVCERLMKVLTSDSMAKSMSAEALRKDYEALIEKQKSEKAKGKDKAPRVPRTVKDNPGKQISVDRALAAVGDASGPYNWALLEPDRLELHNAGYGGLVEMKEWLNEELVLFGMIRFTFGRDTVASSMEGMTAAPAVVKYIFIHWVGPKVSAVRRGKWNAQQKKADAQVRSVCSITFRREAHSLEELELSDLISELLRLAVVDGAVSDAGKSKISVEEYMASLALEQQKQMEAEMEELGDDESQSELPQLDVAVDSVRAAGGEYNWVLLGMQKPPDSKAAAKAANLGKIQEETAETPNVEEEKTREVVAAEAKKAEEERLAKEAAAAAAKKAEAERLAQKAAAAAAAAKKAEDERLTNEAAAAEAKKAEEERLAKEAAAAEAKKAEEERLAKEAAAAEAKKAEEERLAKEAAAAEAKKAEEERLAKEAAAAEAKKAEEERLAKEAAAAEAKKAEEERLAKEAAAAAAAAAEAKKAEEERLAKEAAAVAAEAKKAEEERLAKEAAAAAAAAKKAEEERLANEAAAAEAKKAEEERLAKEAAAASEAKKAEEERLAKEAAAAAAKKAEEERLAKEAAAAAAAKKAEEERLANGAAVAEAKKAEEERFAKKAAAAAEAKKSEEERLAKEAAVAEAKKAAAERLAKEEAVAETRKKEAELGKDEAKSSAVTSPPRSPILQADKGYPRRASLPAPTMNTDLAAAAAARASIRAEAPLSGVPPKDTRLSQAGSPTSGRAAPRLAGKMKLKSGWGWWWARRHVELRAGKLQWWRKEPQGPPDVELRLSDGVTRWVLMRHEGATLELICESRSGSTSKAMGERVLLRAESQAEALEWVTALREQMEYVETLLAWPMPLEGRQGDVRYYGIEYPT